MRASACRRLQSCSDACAVAHYITLLWRNPHAFEEVPQAKPMNCLFMCRFALAPPAQLISNACMQWAPWADGWRRSRRAPWSLSTSSRSTTKTKGICSRWVGGHISGALQLYGFQSEPHTMYDTNATHAGISASPLSTRRAVAVARCAGLGLCWAMGPRLSQMPHWCSATLSCRMCTAEALCLRVCAHAQVQIFEDPVYGTPVFKTLSGKQQASGPPACVRHACTVPWWDQRARLVSCT